MVAVPPRRTLLPFWETAITGRSFCLAFVAGAGLVQMLPSLPAPLVLWLTAAVGAASCVSLVRVRNPLVRVLAALALGLSAGLVNAAMQAQYRLDDALADAHQDQVSRLELRVAGLPDGDAKRQRFLAELNSPVGPGIPSHIQVTWQAGAGANQVVPQMLPGQVWRMALVLRRPHGLLNPAGPDTEGRMFANGIRATGTVRGQPVLLADRPWATPGIVIERARHHVREGMRAALGEHRYAPVMIALAIGDQAGVARDDWRIFNRSGITHLVSISGMHVTSIAGIAGLLASALWRRLRWRGVGVAERMPARIAGGAVAALVALLYCLLAGWGVPARRTFFMLLVVLVAALSRLPLSGDRVLAGAAAAVVALDPWAPVSAGFWLSFGAVAMLLRIVAAPIDVDAGWWAGCAARLRQAVQVQLLVTVGLMPLLAFLVHQVSLGSPFANAVAIPSVTFVVTPLALLCAALSCLPGAQALAAMAGQAGLAAFDLTMAPVAWVGNASWSSVPVAAAGWPWLLLAVAGMVWALQTRGWPGRHLGWCCMLPLLLWRPDRPEPGHWRMSAMDVGQGSAILVEMANQSLLFDAGPRSYGGSDAGERVVAPFLQSRGIGRLNVLVLSHADMDHVGGTRAVLGAVAVGRSYASFDLSAFLRRDARMWPEGGNAQPVLPEAMARCERGVQWEADGVMFTFLHPAPSSRSAKSDDRNADSCVLHVAGASHSLLLTGDIGVAQEKQLVEMGLANADVVMAPHHGSASSSGKELVNAVDASHVIAQAGHLNRFRHPARAVELRWMRSGSRFWRSDNEGAVMAESRPGGLEVWGQRESAGRYWQGR